MKRNLTLFFCLLLIFSCQEKKEVTKNTKTIISICRCLIEPGNTVWAKTNKEDCDSLIGKKIGVPNWKAVNFSKNIKLSEKWDNMINDCVNNQLENDSQEPLVKEISFEEAKAFVQERFQNIGQLYLNGKTTHHNKGDFKVYCFISQNIEHKEYYCLSRVSSKKLEVLGDVNCGKSEIISNFNNY